MTERTINLVSECRKRLLLLKRRDFKSCFAHPILSFLPLKKMAGDEIDQPLPNLLKTPL